MRPRRRRARLRGQAGVGFVLAALVVATLAIGPLATGDPDAIVIRDRLEAPSRDHLLGTDAYGRDQLARVVAGGRRSLGASVVLLVLVVGAGLAVGVAVGLAGGVLDTVAMRVVDVVFSIPSLILALAVVGVLGPGFANLLLALGVSYLAYHVRLARSMVLAARNRPDVLAARMAGVSLLRVVIGHIVPGVAVQLAVVATLELGGVIVSLAGLSFLGLGAQPPTAEWGTMLNDARGDFRVAPWLLAAPAAAIVLTALAANLLGDAARDRVSG